jgi:hypothetical protein
LGRSGWNSQDFYPVVGLSNPVSISRRITRSSKSESTPSDRLIVSYDDPEILDFNLKLYKHIQQSQPKNEVEMITALRNFAVELAGEEGADELLEIWLALDKISNDLMVLNFGPILKFGPILGRWINRPLVPFPEELSTEETKYYRPFLFQAKGKEQANNLIDIQAMRMFEGYGARLLVQRVFEMVMKNLTNAEKLAQKLRKIEKDPSRIEQWNNLEIRLAVLNSLVKTIDNVVAYQALLDLVKTRGVEPEKDPVLGTAATWDRQEIQRIARNEIDNSVRLKRILETSSVPLIHTSQIAEYETIRVLGPELPSQLKQKIDIMNKHWLDYNRLYTAPNM